MGARMPATARAALYLLLQVGAVGAIQISFALFVLLRAMLAGQSPSALLNGASSQPERVFGWGGLAELEWLSLLVTLGLTWLFVRFVDREPFSVTGFTAPRVLPLHGAAGLILGGLLFGSVLIVGIAAGWFHLAGASSPVTSAALLAGGLLIL